MNIGTLVHSCCKCRNLQFLQIIALDLRVYFWREFIATSCEQLWVVSINKLIIVVWYLSNITSQLLGLSPGVWIKLLRYGCVLKLFSRENSRFVELGLFVFADAWLSSVQSWSANIDQILFVYLRWLVLGKSIEAPKFFICSSRLQR